MWALGPREQEREKKRKNSAVPPKGGRGALGSPISVERSNRDGDEIHPRIQKYTYESSPPHSPLLPALLCYAS